MRNVPSLQALKLMHLTIATAGDCVAAEVTPNGPAGLYISRTRLNDNRDCILGEDRIKDETHTQGYEMYHPQHHSTREQFGRYATAKRIVSLDGSALHMISMRFNQAVDWQ